MKRISLILILSFLLLIAVPASAQSEVRLAVAQVQLWPEYDDPSMLVIYTLQLPDDQDLPVDISLRMPASAGEPLAVAVVEDSNMVTRPYEYSVDGAWATLTVTVDVQLLRVEYYDPALSQSDNPRSYTYAWPGDYAVDEFIVSVQEPVGASQMTVESEIFDFGDPIQQQDGLNYFGANLGIIGLGESFDVEIGYTKGGTNLTIESFEQTSAAPTTNQTTQTQSLGGLPAWAWVVIGVGAAFIMVGVVDFLRNSKKPSRPSSYRQKKQRSSSRSASASSTSGKKVFCHNCGQPAEPGDKFCRECGTELRV